MIVVLARAFYAPRTPAPRSSRRCFRWASTSSCRSSRSGRLGLAGLALGIAAGAWFESLLLLGLLARRDPRFRPGAVARAALLDAVGAVAGRRGRVAGHRRRCRGRPVGHGQAGRTSSWAPPRSPCGRGRVPRSTAACCTCPSWRARWPSRGRPPAAWPAWRDASTARPPAIPRSACGRTRRRGTPSWPRPRGARTPSRRRGRRSRRANGWVPERVVVDAADGPIGAQLLVHRLGPSPWSIGYAPRGPVATRLRRGRSDRLDGRPPGRRPSACA